MTSMDDIIAAMERSLADPDPVLVAAVRAKVNAGVPWWRRWPAGDVAAMAGAALDLEAADPEVRLTPDDPWLVSKVMTRSRLPITDRTRILAEKTVWAIAAIRDWNSKPH